MGLLKWFNKETYGGLGEVLGLVKKELESLQPQDSADIVWSKTHNGMSASIRKVSTGSQTESGESGYVGSGSGGAYTGFFKVVNKLNNTYAVIDGHSGASGSSICGTTDLPGASNVPYFEFVWDTNSKVSLYLYACYADGKYSAVVGTEESPPDNVFDSRQVGGVHRNGSTFQSLYTNESISYSKDWYL